jgi:hypothetical protein
MILLNGVPYSDTRYIASLGSKDIRKIEILTPNFFIGNITVAGILSIYTYKTEIPAYYLKNNALVYTNEVVSSENSGNIRPVENSYPEDRLHFPDFRDQLYWNPDIMLGGGSKVTLKFSASSLKGRYLVNIQGITGHGDPLSAKLVFEVQ